MATNFPTSLDNFTNPSSGNTLDSPSHSLQHSDANDAIEAIEAKLGVGASPAGSATAGQVLTISAAGTSAWTTPGLTQVVATSVAVGSGSGSVDSNGKVSFSGASSISLNGVFTSTYDNYRILLNVTAQTGDANFNARLRVSNSDNSSSSYSYAGIKVPHAGTLTLDSAAGTTLWKLGENYNTYDDFMNLSIDLFNPKATANTKFNSQTFGGTTAGAYGTFIQSGVFNATDSFDGITFYPASGTITGTIRVYGYRN